MPTDHMSQSPEQDRARKAAREAQEARGAPAQAPGQVVPSLAAALVAARGRGNGPVRAAALQRLQQTYGNRAMQRYLQRQPGAAGPAKATAEDLGAQIRARSGAGAGLEPGVQRRLEAGLGADMSSVRVHTDGEADRLARSVDAVAFTTGSDIFFSAGAYNPGSSDGLRLLAHEATHTVQQAAGPVAGSADPRGVSISDPGDSFEQAAEASAARVVAAPAPAQAGPASPAGPAALQRQPAALDEEELPAQLMPAGQSIQREPVDEEEEL